ncbi:MAG: BamA/TamA family outer membrane protein [Candidatus Riflebacteria bacterium]|nr:BamA/TamA family outer membrane protein [Candidatus Riflebacteria bacterium]
MQFEGDGTDDLLDPTYGHRLELRLTPAVDPFGDSVEFIKSVARHSSYWRMGRTERLVLATRETLGSLAGAARPRSTSG